MHLRRWIPYAFRILAAAVAVAGIILATDPDAPGVELLIGALVFAQLGGAFPTVRPHAARELETLIDEGREIVGRLGTHLAALERGERSVRRPEGTR